MFTLLLAFVGIVSVCGTKPLPVEEYLKQHAELLTDKVQQRTQWDCSSAMRDLKKSHPAVPQAVGDQQIDLENCYLYAANRMDIIRLEKDGTFTNALTGLSNAIAIDFDRMDGYLLWSDVSDHTISRSRVDGSELSVLVDSGITTPDGIAWDWLYKRLYWTDADEYDLEMYDPSTAERKVLIQNGDQSKPRAIVLDSDARYMYWTDWGNPPSIERASMDGSNRTVLHSTDLVWPNALTVDFATQILYWMDGSLDRLESSKTDGSERTLLSTIQIYHPFGISFFEGDLYWSDWQLDAILTISLSDLSKVTVVGNFTQDPMGLVSVCSGKQANGLCTKGCLHGVCLGPDKCTCYDGWEGTLCNQERV